MCAVLLFCFPVALYSKYEVLALSEEELVLSAMEVEQAGFKSGTALIFAHVTSASSGYISKSFALVGSESGEYIGVDEEVPLKVTL